MRRDMSFLHTKTKEKTGPGACDHVQFTKHETDVPLSKIFLVSFQGFAGNGRKYAK